MGSHRVLYCLTLLVDFFQHEMAEAFLGCRLYAPSYRDGVSIDGFGIPSLENLDSARVQYCHLALFQHNGSFFGRKKGRDIGCVIRVPLANYQNKMAFLAGPTDLHPDRGTREY